MARMSSTRTGAGGSRKLWLGLGVGDHIGRGRALITSEVKGGDKRDLRANHASARFELWTDGRCKRSYVLRVIFHGGCAFGSARAYIIGCMTGAGDDENLKVVTGATVMRCRRSTISTPSRPFAPWFFH